MKKHATPILKRSRDIRNQETYQAIFTPLIIGMIVDIGNCWDKNASQSRESVDCREAHALEDVQTTSALRGLWRVWVVAACAFKDGPMQGSRPHDWGQSQALSQSQNGQVSRAVLVRTQVNQ
jgi:hypothetical protein